MNDEIYLIFKGRKNALYNELMNNGYDDVEFEVILEENIEEDEYNNNEFYRYSITFNNALYNEQEIIGILKDKFKENIQIIL